jgi:hypothetical protein
MIHIGFYLSNKNTKDVDCSDVFYGNLDIRGSEYAMLLLACSLVLNFEDLWKLKGLLKRDHLFKHLVSKYVSKFSN